MLKGAVAGRYAEALFAIASKEKALTKQEKTIDKIEAELKIIETVINENEKLQQLLYHPRISVEDKKGVLEKLFKGKISQTTSNFLGLLIDRRREAFFCDIVTEYVKLANDRRNIVAAQVASAVELNEKEKGELDRVLDKLTGKKVRTSYVVDPSLIGGIVVRMGDKIIDGSIKTRLATMKESLKAIS
jgi:F-type H+-transporting ATPase subunit delta